MLKLCDAAERAIAFVGLTAAAILLPLLVVVRVYEIVARRLAEDPTTVPSEFLQFIEWEALILLVMLIIGLAAVRDGHVRVDILRERMSLRWRLIIDTIGLVVFVLPVSVIALTYGLDFVITSWRDGERLALALGGPYRWALRASLLVGLAMVLIASLCAVVRGWHRLTDPERPAREG